MRTLRFVLLTALLAGACSDLTSEPARPEAQGLVLSVDAVPGQITPGDTVRIVARLRNTNPHEVTLNFSSGCQILFYVRNSAGKTVEPQDGGWGCYQVLTGIRIGAEQSETRSFVWTGEQVVGHEAGTWRPILQPLPAGVYHVHVALADAAELNGKRITLRTDPIAVTLR